MDERRREVEDGCVGCELSGEGWGVLVVMRLAEVFNDGHDGGFVFCSLSGRSLFLQGCGCHDVSPLAG